MSLAGRILDAVTLRRVVAVLLIGGFADAIFSFMRWLASVGWELKDVSTLRACLLAAVEFALDASLIYLALRGLGSVLERRRSRAVAREAATREQDPPVQLEEVDGVGADAARRPREGGGDDRGSDYY